MKKKGFTLIELLAVIVILAILALITVPIVLKLVNNARKDSSVRSAENYLDGVKKAVMNDVINSETEIDECEVQTNGNLICNGDISLTIDVDGKKPTYGTINFSGGSISDVTDLRFGKYYISGEVQNMVASTKASKEDRPDGTFLIGDKFTYKGERYYVIEKSDASKEYVVAMKMFPLSKEEIENFGLDEEGKNHINVFGNTNYRGTVGKYGENGVISWYSAESCFQGQVCTSTESCSELYGYCWTDTNCTDIKDFSSCPSSYDGSNIKVIVDNWSKMRLDLDDLVKIDGYKVRLLKAKEAVKNLRYTDETSGYSTALFFSSSKTPRWAKDISYKFWLMDVDEDYPSSAYILDNSSILSINMWEAEPYRAGAVRPVINLKKTAIGH